LEKAKKLENTVVKNKTRLASLEEIVLVGGDVRPEIIAIIEQKLGVKVHWVRTSKQGYAPRLEQTICRLKVTVVCLLIRWSRHKFSQSVPQLCKKYKKALVRVPCGRGANQLEFQIQNQISKQLNRA
jgi:hypothetical protein